MSSNNVKVMRNKAKQKETLEKREELHTIWCPGVKTKKGLSLAKQVI